MGRSYIEHNIDSEAKSHARRSGPWPRPAMRAVYKSGKQPVDFRLAACAHL